MIVGLPITDIKCLSKAEERNPNSSVEPPNETGVMRNDPCNLNGTGSLQRATDETDDPHGNAHLQSDSSLGSCEIIQSYRVCIFL